MDSNSTSTGTKDSTCPTTPGLASENGFRPGFDWHSLITDPAENWHIWGWALCLLCLVIMWIIAIIAIRKHFKNYYEPTIQRHKVRVLLYPPFYSTLAWISYLRYDYATTIMFFAALFEAFAVYNLYALLQAYLHPFREEAEGVKEEARPTVIPFVKVHVKSRWGMHYRIITDILVLQYPIWAILDAFISIFAELKGHYCESSYSFKGAHVYLVIINFVCLSLIISALFTYIAVFKEEWKRAKVSAHGLFWCVKGPIMFNFYIGTLLLSGLAYCGVIHGTDGSNSSDGLAWSTAAVQNGLLVIIICVVMTVAMGLMTKYYNESDSIRRFEENDTTMNNGPFKKLSAWDAFMDAYVMYIPEFIRNVVFCGRNSRALHKKRQRLKEEKEAQKQQLEMTGLTSSPTGS
ncbi:organic solute transporter Ostalpha-domain-containing protein [Gongronella butleri]|nr:organic solute transporter Ostalpha-domain-containing protein [Gongronella butleri]